MGVFLCRRGDGKFDNIETDHATLGDLHDALVERGIVLGSILITRRGDDGSYREVLRRVATIITPRTFDQISDCTIRFVEAV